MGWVIRQGQDDRLHNSESRPGAGRRSTIEHYSPNSAKKCQAQLSEAAPCTESDTRRRPSVREGGLM
eukprot:9278819-Pyramimonas_sp.AAC.1